jgi:pyridoxamine 5'-phosphate oxidase
MTRAPGREITQQRFEEARFDEHSVAADPLAQFGAWLSDATEAGLPEPTAMALATVNASGQPRARTVLLKSHDASGFTFYTNRASRKASDLTDVPRASLLFGWYAIHRQVIIEGTVRVLTKGDSEPYFHSRPRGSQLGAWASHQSTVVGSRDELDQRYAELEQRWPEPAEVPMPDFWGGYQVVPEVYEFWQGRVNRLHDRLRYRRESGRWLLERLAP